jgi:hypothetical protein
MKYSMTRQENGNKKNALRSSYMLVTEVIRYKCPLFAQISCLNFWGKHYTVKPAHAVTYL